MGGLANAIKLNTVVDGATADLTSSEVKTKYESNADTNAFTSAYETDVDNIPVIESWIALTLANNWVEYNTSGYGVASYRKDEFGTVHVRAMLTNGTIGVPAFTLPVGYRPIGRKIIAGISSGDVMGRIDVLSNGDVRPQSGATAWFSFQFSFKAEQ